MNGMIFAAGLGTRLAPLTNSRPKALVEVNGQPLLKYAIDNMYSAGVRHLVVNVHHFADMIINYLQKNAHLTVCVFLSVISATSPSVSTDMAPIMPIRDVIFASFCIVKAPCLPL